MSRPLDQRPEVNDQLIDAALETFIALGYSKTTMSDIARTADISRPTLYRRFEDKSAVFLAVAQALHLEAHERYVAAAATSGPLFSRLAAVSIAKVETVLHIADASVHGPELLDVNQRIAGASAIDARSRLLELLCAMYEEADGSEIDLANAGFNPALASRTVLAIVDGWIIAATTSGGPSTRRWRSELTAAIKTLTIGMTPP